MDTFQCQRCNLEKPIQTKGGMGYATLDNTTADVVCYDCCALLDREHMQRENKITLYLTIDKLSGGWTVSNWPGTLKYRAMVRKGDHNIARTRYDAWFIDADGNNWHGVQYGEFTQLVHCRKLKGKHHPLRTLRGSHSLGMR